MDEEGFVTGAVIRKHFSVSEETLKRARATGLEYVQMGSRYRYKKSWFREWMDKDTRRFEEELLPVLRERAANARASKRSAAKKKPREEDPAA